MAGDPHAAFDRSVSIAEDFMATGFEKKHDLVVVSAYPATTDLWQSGKGFYNGDLLVKDGGTLVLVTPLDEGLGDHPEFISLLEKSPAEILAVLDSGKLEDPLAAVASYAIRRISERCRLRIVTNNRSIVGHDLLGAPISGDIDSATAEAFRDGARDLAVVNDSYILPKTIVKG